MRLPDKSRALAQVLADAARRHGVPSPAALDEVAERACDAGFKAAEAQARGDLERAKRSIERHLNEVAKLRGEIERLRR